MTSQNHQEANSSTPAPASASSEHSVRLSARRQLLKGGLAAAPVVMSAASRPVLAQTQCHGPTGFQSANISRMVGVVADSKCGLRKTPSTWLTQINNNGALPQPYVKTDKFKAHFVGTTKFAADTDTLESVLRSTATGNDIAIAKLVVAALLNSASTTVPSLDQIKTMWLGYCGGNYRPNGETAWTPNKFINYLNYTMGVAVPKTSW